jgi:predicted Zn-dependent protease
MQKTRPGAVARVLATHPMDADRIDRTEKEIQRILPSKPEYVVTTSEYRAMRDRLLALENGRKPSTSNRPHLIRSGDDKLPDTDSDTARPTIKRKDIVD